MISCRVVGRGSGGRVTLEGEIELVNVVVPGGLGVGALGGEEETGCGYGVG